MRRHARLRRGPGLLRPRDPDGQACQRARDGPPGAPHEERAEAWRRVPVRPGGAAPRAGEGDPGARQGHAPARGGRGGGPRPAPSARRRLQRDARRGCEARRRLRRRLQEHRLLGRLRRLFDGTRHSFHPGWRASGSGPHGGGGGGAGAHHDRGPDRTHRAGRREGGRAPRGHEGGFSRLHLGLAPDLRDRRRWSSGPAKLCASASSRRRARSSGRKTSP